MQHIIIFIVEIKHYSFIAIGTSLMNVTNATRHNIKIVSLLCYIVLLALA